MSRQVLTRPGTPIRFNPMGPGPSGDVSFTSLMGLHPGSGAVSEVLDLGSGARSLQYTWRARHKLNVKSSYDSVNHYLSTSDDGVWWDGNLPSGDMQLGNLQLLARDLQNVGSVAVNVDETTPSGTDSVIITSGMLNISARYVRVVTWNDTNSALSNNSADHEITLTPLPDEVQ